MGATSQKIKVDGVELKIREGALKEAKEQGQDTVLLQINGENQEIPLDNIRKMEESQSNRGEI